MFNVLKRHQWQLGLVKIKENKMEGHINKLCVFGMFKKKNKIKYNNVCPMCMTILYTQSSTKKKKMRKIQRGQFMDTHTYTQWQTINFYEGHIRQTRI